MNKISTLMEIINNVYLLIKLMEILFLNLIY